MARPPTLVNVQVRPGEKLPTESAQAAQAWFLYRDDGPDRNLRKTARDVHKSLTTVAQWSKRHRWPERALAWDGYQDGIHTAALLREAEAGATDWAREREAERARELELGQALIAKAKTMVEWPLAQREITRDGQTTIIMPTKWRMADAAKYIEVGTKLIRLAAEMETDRVGIVDLRQEAERIAAATGADPEWLLRRAQEIADAAEAVAK